MISYKLVRNKQSLTKLCLAYVISILLFKKDKILIHLAGIVPISLEG
jgi:hypothetical protein